MDRSKSEIQRIQRSGAAAFAALPDANVDCGAGEPEAVHTSKGKLAYWLVAGLHQGRVRAVARILLDARVATVGLVKGTPADAPEAATGLSAAGASRLAKELLAQYPDSQVSSPMLVHDGPVGREAWLFTVKRKSGQPLWIFATGGGTYSRHAGEELL
jgi:hypothetical protein